MDTRDLGTCHEVFIVNSEWLRCSDENHKIGRVFVPERGMWEHLNEGAHNHFIVRLRQAMQRDPLTHDPVFTENPTTESVKVGGIDIGASSTHKRVDNAR